MYICMSLVPVALYTNTKRPSNIYRQETPLNAHYPCTQLILVIKSKPTRNCANKTSLMHSQNKYHIVCSYQQENQISVLYNHCRTSLPTHILEVIGFNYYL